MVAQSERILVVDDEPEIRSMLRSALEDVGYACADAGDADAAVELLRQQPFDLALLDVMMPGRSGAQLFHQLQESHPEIGVVFLTARADLGLAVESLRDGAYDYLVKPVSLAEVEQAVERALLKRRALRQREALLSELGIKAQEQMAAAESYARQLRALTRLMQSQSLREQAAEELAGRVRSAALSAAQFLLKLVEEITPPEPTPEGGQRGDGHAPSLVGQESPEEGSPEP